ncbi:MAG: PepSY domain-containing protein [Bacteroidetes bacterium]|nr:PepSY domain-containing protein [Bacteroidota bacterium]
MKKNRFLKFLKWLHRWPGLIAAFFLFFWCLSGIVLNHRQTFANFEVNRKYLAGEYQYKNWNNASLKGSIQINSDSLLVYGNIGVWLTDSSYSSFTDFNKGFRSGIDNRKIFKLLKTENGSLLAATLFGLYIYQNDGWQKIKLPVDEEQTVGLAFANDSVYVMTRSHILASIDNPGNYQFSEIKVFAPSGYDNKIGLFKTLWVIHSGEIYGKIGKLIVDLVAIVFIVLAITGLVYYFSPGIIRRRKNKDKDNSKIKQFNKFSIKWHNKIGIWLAVLLMITTISGMFLRPPMLIAIVNSRVAKLKYTNLDNPNPWFDRFRDILYDEELDRFLIGTVEGIYFSEDHFKSAPVLAPVQPPVSIMGINVFKKIGLGDYLIGSFYGLYRWIPDHGFVQDYISKSTQFNIDRAGPPIGQFMAAGFIEKNDGAEYHIDYNAGIIPLNSRVKFTEMSYQMLQKSPMSLWNFALEVHTGRFFKFIFGDLYILIIPILGLLAFTTILSGVVVWIKLYVRKKRK